MIGLKDKLYVQMEIAEKLLWLYAEIEKKQQMQELLQSLSIHESANHMTAQLQELHIQLEYVQEQFDIRMNEVIKTFQDKIG
ncbi:hypothetical protein [Jeotgalibacillus sp. S-D1]|uniref:hypothetical protein n=1 Tax=Jeotgalibacillus sp. S-D1 TaxID=2552189 RepID=UPI0014044F53|nr:hypothetical protein [Jeotgalibacillus sp. S-D1]